jgi:hypothetical protein
MLVEYSWKPSSTFKNAVRYAVHALCLEDVPGVLTIENLTQPGVMGDAYFDGVDEYTVRVTSEDLGTIFHELVHVMQYANYELEVYGEGNAYWKGQTLEGLTYATCPWEIEAYHIEQVLLKCFNAQSEKNS